MRYSFSTNIVHSIILSFILSLGHTARDFVPLCDTFFFEWRHAICVAIFLLSETGPTLVDIEKSKTARQIAEPYEVEMAGVEPASETIVQ